MDNMLWLAFASAMVGLVAAAWPTRRRRAKKNPLCSWCEDTGTVQLKNRGDVACPFCKAA